MVSNKLGVRFSSLISQWIAPSPRSPRVANHPPCTPHAYVFVRVAVCVRAGAGSLGSRMFYRVKPGG